MRKKFIDLKEIELKDREIKIKREINQFLFLQKIWIGSKKKKKNKNN